MSFELRHNENGIQVYHSTKYFCSDGDSVQVTITDDYLDVACFTGIPGAAMLIVDDLGLEYVAHTLKVAHNQDQVALKLAIADAFCEKMGLGSVTNQLNN